MSLSPGGHPIRWKSLQDAVESWTLKALQATNGSGTVTVEFCFHRWCLRWFRPAAVGPRTQAEEGDPT